MLMRNPYLLLGLSAAFGLGAAVMASHWIESRVSASNEPGGTPVIVASAEIPFGAKITAAQIQTLSWPAQNVPAGAFSSSDDVVGKFANQKLMPGEVILKDRAVELGGGSSLSMQISPTKRALSVRVNDVIGVGGFLLPGNRVDVLATRLTDDHRALTRTLLQNLKVLAVDQTSAADKDKPVVVRAVTLEVEPAEAELLVGATEEGTVQLALRNPDDGALVTNVAAAAKPAPTVVALAARPRPAPAPQVTVIRQAQVMAADVHN
jgi:pilus assembly protein CpaB